MDALVRRYADIRAGGIDITTGIGQGFRASFALADAETASGCGAAGYEQRERARNCQAYHSAPQFHRCACLAAAVPCRMSVIRLIHLY